MNPLTKNKDLAKKLLELMKEPDYYLPIYKDTYLFRQGEVANELYLIISGQVVIGKTTSDGRELTIRYCGPNDLVGEFTTGQASIQYLVDGKITEPGEVAVFNQEKLLDQLQLKPQLMIELLSYFSLQQRKDQLRFRDLLLYGKKGALYSTLIRLANSYGQETEDGILINKHLTNQEIAHFCATTRESVNRQLTELRRNNVIQIEHGLITILELDTLRKAINCENCPIELCTID